MNGIRIDVVLGMLRTQHAIVVTLDEVAAAVEAGQLPPPRDIGQGVPLWCPSCIPHFVVWAENR